MEQEAFRCCCSFLWFNDPNRGCNSRDIQLMGQFSAFEPAEPRFLGGGIVHDLFEGPKWRRANGS